MTNLRISLFCNPFGNFSGKVESIHFGQAGENIILTLGKGFKLKFDDKKGICKIGALNFPYEHRQTCPATWEFEDITISDISMARLMNYLTEAKDWAMMEGYVELMDKWESGKRYPFVKEDFENV